MIKVNLYNIWTRFIAVIFISIIVSSCVKNIDPDVEIYDTDKYVISGIFTDRPGYQELQITRTSPINNPEKIYVNNCIVKVIRDDNVEVQYYGYQLGTYSTYISADFIKLNKGYKIEVTTADGIVIQSDYEYFTSSPEVGDVYWETEKMEASSLMGYQFYMDMHAQQDNSKFYLYNITETFEHHSPYPLEYWYNGQLHREVPPDYSKMYCWVTVGIHDVFPLSTKEFSSNVYDKYKLNYTNSNTQRLQHTYSLLIEQFSLTERAYNYWFQMRENLHQNGGMYNSQPTSVKGNLHSISGSDKEVLGYFGVSTIKEKRIFVPPSPFEIVDNSCQMRSLRFGFSEISWSEYPAYIYSEDGLPQPIVMDKTCVDCTKLGGYTQKPSYWP